ncbi:MAG: CdaR family protein [Prevotella sp.]
MTIVRDLLFGTFNREFLIFLFFLVLSAAYWVMSVLNDTMEREVTVHVQLSGVPKNVILLDEDNMDIHATVRDKGYTIAAYLWGDKLKTVKIPFSTFARGRDRCTVSNGELVKLISQQLYGSSKIVQLKPDKLEFPYNLGMNRRYPVKLYGKVRPADTYYLAQVKFQPESVYVYSSEHLLDSISEIYTERLNIVNFTDTLRRKVKLRHIHGAKPVPSEVTVTFCPDIMIEATASVPVMPVNVPEGRNLRFFPPAVTVSYVVGASHYKNIGVDKFVVVADYNTTKDGTAEQCQLKLVKAPREARNPKLTTTSVDYLIEQ